MERGGIRGLTFDAASWISNWLWRAQFGGLVTANFAIVFNGPAIRRARRELVNIQGGTIALLEDCNSSLAFLPLLSSPSFSRQKRFEFGGRTAVDKGRARYSLIFFVKVSKRTKMYGHSFIKHFVVRILFEKMIVIGWWIQISVWRILEIKILFALTRGEILERIQHSYHGAAYSHPLRRKFCPCWDNTTREKTRDACSYRSNTSPLSIQILRKIGNKGYNVTNDNFLKKISLKKRCFDPIVKSTRTIPD